MFNIFSSKRQDESTKTESVPLEKCEVVENEFTSSARKINERIAITEKRIKEEIDSLLNDLTPTDFDLEVKTLRDYSKISYSYKSVLDNCAGRLNHIGVVTKSSVTIKILL